MCTISHSGESGMTAEAGQTSTKNPIVNSKRNNDTSRIANKAKGDIQHAVAATSQQLLNSWHPISSASLVPVQVPQLPVSLVKNSATTGVKTSSVRDSVRDSVSP